MFHVPTGAGRVPPFEAPVGHLERRACSACPLTGSERRFGGRLEHVMFQRTAAWALEVDRWTVHVAAGVPELGATFVTVEAADLVEIIRTPTNLMVHWPTVPAGFILQERPNLQPTSTWTDSNREAIQVGDKFQATFIPAGTQSFFRLRGP